MGIQMKEYTEHNDLVMADKKRARELATKYGVDVSDISEQRMDKLVIKLLKFVQQKRQRDAKLATEQLSAAKKGAQEQLVAQKAQQQEMEQQGLGQLETARQEICALKQQLDVVQEEVISLRNSHVDTESTISNSMRAQVEQRFATLKGKATFKSVIYFHMIKQLFDPIVTVCLCSTAAYERTNARKKEAVRLAQEAEKRATSLGQQLTVCSMPREKSVCCFLPYFFRRTPLP